MWSRMMDTCTAAGLNLPCLVKSVTACGLSAAHAMTLVLRPEVGGNAASPLSAHVQGVSVTCQTTTVDMCRAGMKWSA